MTITLIHEYLGCLLTRAKPVNWITPPILHSTLEQIRECQAYGVTRRVVIETAAHQHRIVERQARGNTLLGACRVIDISVLVLLDHGKTGGKLI